jgi:hypothetical protein
MMMNLSSLGLNFTAQSVQLNFTEKLANDPLRTQYKQCKTLKEYFNGI